MAKCEQCGTHRGPGKFEGEPCYAAHLWDGDLDYDFYDGETPVSRVEVDAELVAQFPCGLDAGDIGKVVLLWESDQGFVYSRLCTVDEAAQVEADCEADASAEEST